MKIERYEEIMTEFETLLRYGMEVSHRLVGTRAAEHHLSYADPIYTKLLCHAISLHKLLPQTKEKPEHELWDLPSACAIARCIIEAHDVLGYVVLSDISPEERGIRLLVWRLHDKQRRSKMLSSIQSRDPMVNELHDQVRELVSEVTKHSWYPNIPKHLRKKIDDGDAPSFLLSQRELNAANSVNHEHHVYVTMWLSQYVHTFPMSVHQLVEFKAGTPEALRICSMPIQCILGFMAKSIIGMASTFAEGNMKVNEEDINIISSWCSIVETGVTTTSFVPVNSGDIKQF